MRNILMNACHPVFESSARVLVQFFVFVILFCGVSIASATTIALVNNDGANEGFNDNGAAFAGQTGNSGSTLGEQRLNVFQAAADYWEAKIDSAVIIRVSINFDPLTCSSNSAILGSAGPNSVFRDFPGAPIANTWYVEAVANSLVGSDGDGTSDDISAQFNSDIDNNNSCLNGTNWWYGINSPAPGGTISLFDTVLHEIGHGLGFLSLVSSSGARFDGRNDAYAYHLFDEQTQKFWRNMSDGERTTSSTNGPNLTWSGVNADSNSGHLNSAVSRTNGNIRMYAPNPFQSGSSVSHWDTSLSPDELMEPSATPTSDDRSTVQLLKDIGWNLVAEPGEIGFVSQNPSVRENKGLVRISVQRSGGVDGAVSVTASTSNITATAGLDYTSVSLALNWADGEAGIKTFDISINDDQIEEPAETVGLTLTGATNGATISSPGTATLTIRDPIKADDDDGFLLSTMPAVIAAALSRKPPPPVVVNPRWSVVNEVCCSTSSATFRVNQGSDNRSSTAPSCNVAAPQSTEVESTAGNKGFSFSLEASGCGTLADSFNFAFQEKTRYLFAAQFANGGVNINVFSGPINRTATAQNTVGNSGSGLTHERTIRLSNVIQGESSSESMTGSFQSIEK